MPYVHVYDPGEACALENMTMAKGKSPERTASSSRRSGGSRIVYKSAITGRFVTKKTVKSKPKTTYKQTVER